MSFILPGFDELLDRILTDYRNQQFADGSRGIDTSKGSLAFIKAACSASALWGLYQHQGWIAAQIFPDGADPENLERHVWVRGLQKKVGETDPQLLARLLDFIRRPPAGGNRYDFVKWALEVEGVQSAICIPTGQGPGTVDVVISADPATGSEVPDGALLAAVYDHIVDLSPAAKLVTRILAPEVIVQDVTIELAAPDLDPATVAQAITVYMASFTLGQSLYVAQLIAVALGGYEGDVTVTTPVANVVATPTQLIRPGVISVA